MIKATEAAINIPKGTNSLTLEKVTESTVAEGIVYEERLYRDPDGLPVRAYIITVAKGAASFVTLISQYESYAVQDLRYVVSVYSM